MLNVIGLELLHPFRQASIRRLDHQVEVVRHQGPHMNDPAELFHHPPKKVKEVEPVLVIEEDIAPVALLTGE
jgi:hypothetical protein